MDHASLPGLAGQAWIGLISGDRTGECCGGRPLFISSYFAPRSGTGDPGAASPARAINTLSPRSCGAYSAAVSGRGRPREHRQELDLEAGTSCLSLPVS
ncbi:hypothetical protein NDU88_004252 [Pleurodeles waltl]|uniref:Uncharacterized protein n=1 Tax=Pleurodeles waltl TaxID=8319 RepID=A0AAV7MUY2_PLEWA|nr:hypothetical protein NDU88_004252 [Pleurodeles waltl]